jgi:hypothetical protein
MTAKKQNLASKVAVRYLTANTSRFSVVIQDERSRLAIMKALDKALRTAGLNVVEVNHDSETNGSR